jgi:cysteine desulfurase
MNRVYLDYNASSPLLEPVKVAMIEAFDVFGNGSSVHSQGREVHSRIESARELLAKMVGARSQDVIFTSGGTEANNLALTPSLFPKDLQADARLYVSAIEHPSVLNGMRFEKDQITVIPVTRDGVVDVEWLRAELLSSEEIVEEKNKNEPPKKVIKPILVSVMAANNETGIIQPIAEIAEIVHEAGGLLHSDCVQVLGKVPLLLPMTNADLITVSAHKIGGPQGVGALIVREASVVLRDPLVAGGGQELKRRGGTENMAGIVGFGVAAKVVNESFAAEQTRVKKLRDELEAGILNISPDAIVFGKGVERLGHVCCFAVPDFSAETQVIQFDLMNICISSGSACSSGKVEHSHVLKAMAVKENLSHAALRISLGSQSNSSDIDSFLKAWESIYTRAKKRGCAA